MFFPTNDPTVDPAGSRFLRRHLRMAGNPFILIFNPIPETEEML